MPASGAQRNTHTASLLPHRHTGDGHVAGAEENFCARRHGRGVRLLRRVGRDPEAVAPVHEKAFGEIGDGNFGARIDLADDLGLKRAAR